MTKIFVLLSSRVILMVYCLISNSLLLVKSNLQHIEYPRAFMWSNHMVAGSTSDSTKCSVVYLPPFLESSGPTILKILRKILGRFLILRQSLTISGKTLTWHNFALLTNSRFNNNFMQQRPTWHKNKSVNYNH